MEQAGVTIVGAGVVGLAIANRLSTAMDNLVVLERHDGFGRETSSRNSEVIHAGLYYPPESLKAQFCVEGNRLLCDLCERKGIPFRRTGKLVVAQTEEDCAELARILERTRACSAEGVRMLCRAEWEELEPNVRCREALLSPGTGVVDTHQLMEHLAASVQSQGALICYRCEVIGIEPRGGRFRLTIMDGASGETVELETDILVNAAGLGADAIARMAGLDIDRLGYRLRYCKGEYFTVSGRHHGALRHLVYPAPTKHGLGIHATLDLMGRMRLGPNDFFVDAIDYEVDESHGEEFFRSACAFLPFLRRDDLSPDTAGIRPKLQGPDEGFRDFIIADERDHGVPGLINLIGIESPGLTASPAIALRVEDLIQTMR